VDCSTIYLQRIDDQQFVEASICDEITDTDLKRWEETWVPAMLEAVERNIRENLPREKWPQDLHWNWRKKVVSLRQLLGLRGFSILREDHLEGLMIVNLTKQARLPTQRGKPIAYVDYLSTAPWNRKEIVPKPRYRGVGRAAVLAAVKLSQSEEFKGRVGLHSLPQSEQFYERKCGMTPFEKDPKKQNLMYFEMTEEQATAFESAK
jgi:hypothetical protein